MLFIANNHDCFTPKIGIKRKMHFANLESRITSIVRLEIMRNVLRWAKQWFGLWSWQSYFVCAKIDPSAQLSSRSCNFFSWPIMLPEWPGSFVRLAWSNLSVSYQVQQILEIEFIVSSTFNFTSNNFLRKKKVFFSLESKVLLDCFLKYYSLVVKWMKKKSHEYFSFST